MKTPDTKPEMPQPEGLSHRDLFGLGQEVARRGEPQPTEGTGLAESFAFRGLLPDGSKIRIRYTKNQEFTHDDTWLKRSNEGTSTARNGEHVYIEGRDIYSVLNRFDIVYGGTLRTEEKYGAHTDFNDRNLVMEEVIRNIQPDESPVQEKPQLTDKLPGENIFSLAIVDRYGSEDTGIKIHASSIKDAEERYVEACAQEEDYDAIRFLRTHVTWFEPGGRTYDDADWYR